MVGMEARDVLQILSGLRDAGIRAYVAGGWGIDALIGEQSRAHADLDLAFNVEDEQRILLALGRAGFQMMTDERPARFVLQDGDGRKVDFHPVAFDAAGNGKQVGFGGITYHYPSTEFRQGTIAGTQVRCASLNGPTAIGEKSREACASRVSGQGSCNGRWRMRSGGRQVAMRQSAGTTAVTSISTFAALSISATTCTTDIVG